MPKKTKKELLLEYLSDENNEQVTLCFKNKHTSETTFEYVIVMKENFEKKKKYIQNNFDDELFHKKKKGEVIALFDRITKEDTEEEENK